MIAAFVADGTLDDRRAGAAHVRTASRVKGRGRLRIRRELEARGIDRTLARNWPARSRPKTRTGGIKRVSPEAGAGPDVGRRAAEGLSAAPAARVSSADAIAEALRKSQQREVTGPARALTPSETQAPSHGTIFPTHMTGHEVRQSFLDYFARHGHRIVPSSSLVPADDPTLLFTNAGMNQFKDLFLGQDGGLQARHTAQKCMRVSGKHNDLDNVGPSLRHHTFFEMLGNFSFGDYFKHEAIPFAWELLTKVWQLPPDRLFPTIFKGEAGIPRDDRGVAICGRRSCPASRITELGLADNFWQMGDTGPCGRCSEILYFRGKSIPCPEPVCRGIDCDCERYVEVWNNVFMEFDRSERGTLTPLPAPSIDTGMGLERVTSVIQGKLSNYDTDLFTPILATIGAPRRPHYTGAPGPADHPDVSMRVIADHIRAMSFLIADGVLPSNEWRGYVLRKIMRRAMRHGKKLGLTEPFLHAACGRRRPRDGRRLPGAPGERQHIACDGHGRRRTGSTRCSRPGCRSSKICIARTAASGSKVVPGEASSACTTPSACRWTSPRTWRSARPRRSIASLRGGDGVTA